MKHVKRIANLALALVLVLALSAGVFAADEKGSITIDNAVMGQSYTIYRILELESYNTADKAYSYKSTAAWSEFVNGSDVKDVYLKVNELGYVTWVEGADEAAFAKLVQQYAAAHAEKVGYQGTQEAKSTTVKFENLELGYYLVDSTLGTLCSLNTTQPDVTIKEKNGAPTNEKTVEEDSTGAYGKVNDADIGQTVNFKSTITAQAGAENYVFHDTMSDGLTYGSVTGITLNGNAVEASSYTVKTSGLTDGCTFEIRFEQSFCNTLKADDKIVISYTATVNENAVIGNAGNPNESKLEYGQSGKTTTTPPSTTTTYTWELKVFKYTMNGENEKALDGAVFTLSKSADGANPIALVSEGNTVYRVAKEGESNTVTEITTDTTGKFTIKGLDSDAYYLTEKTAPAGYNTLKEPVEVVINDKGEVKYNKTSTGEVKVLNQTGAELPSTGGMGTTVFYVLGSALVLGAAVVLVTRKRMKERD